MPLIEGIGDEVTLTVGLILVVLCLLLAWTSTNVAYQPFAVIVLDRRSLQAIVQRIRQQATGAAPLNGQAGSGAGVTAQIADHDNEDVGENEDQDQGEDVVGEADGGVPEPQGETPKTDAESGANSDGLSSATTEETTKDPHVSDRLQPSQIPSASAAETETSSPAQNALPGSPGTDLSETELRQRRLAFFSGQRSEGTNTCSVPKVDGEESKISQEATSADLHTGSEVQSTETSADIDHSSAAISGDSNIQDVPLSSTESVDRLDGHIRIRLKYLDERQRLVQAKPEDTIATFKRQHFGAELSANLLVRFVCNGQELKRDSSTLQSYNIVDNSVIHCLLSQMTNTRAPAPQIQAVELDLGAFMFPLFGLILGLIWYCRVMYRSYFNALSTVALIGITFLFLVAFLASWRARGVREHED